MDVGPGTGVGVTSVRLAVENPSWSASQKTLMLWMSDCARNWWMGRSSKVSVMAWNLTAEWVVGTGRICERQIWLGI